MRCTPNPTTPTTKTCDFACVTGGESFSTARDATDRSASSTNQNTTLDARLGFTGALGLQLSIISCHVVRFSTGSDVVKLNRQLLVLLHLDNLHGAVGAARDDHLIAN